MSSVGKPFQGISVKLVLPLVVLLFPIIIVQAYFHYDRFEVRRAEELQANLQMARALGVAFNGLVQDVLRQELAIAAVVMDSPSPLPPVLPKLLRESAQSHPVRSFSWVSPEGRVLVSSKPTFEGIDISDREYFKELASGREWYVSDLVLSKASGEPIFSIARSVRDGKGDLLGFVSATLNAQVVEEVFGFERPKDAGVSLTDRNGMVVATYPAKEFAWEERNWLKLYPEKLGDPLKGRETTAVLTTTTGKKRLVGAAPVPSVGWVAASSRSEDAVLGATQSALLAEGTLFLIVTLAAFATALAVSRPISRSVQRLRDRVLALGRGDKENLTIYPGSTRELNELAQSFSRMAEEVRNRENALRDSESRLRAIFESTEEAIITLDDEQRCLEANPAAGVITGVPHEQLVGRFLREFVDSYASLPFTWEGILRAGRFKGEVRIRHSSGSLRIVEASGVANIGPGRHLFVGHDITERKHAAEVQKASRQDLNRAQALAHIGSWRLDVGQNTLTWSDETYRMFGIPEGTTRTYEKFLSLVHPDDREYVDQEWSSALKGETYDIEHRIIVGHNTKWVREKAELEFNEDGSLKGGFGAVQDITERKQAEANRALLTEILRTLNRGGDMQTLVSDTLRLIQDVTGFDAVGMRLRKNEDCPYFAQVGFSEEFLREENFLCEKGLDGAIVYDQQGRPLLECTCGVVLSGRIDPSMSCFTKAGSFWTNASHELLALPPEADPRTNPRNRCIHAGYESVGLFPVRSGREIVGLLQLNGRAPGRFTPGMITFYENLAQNIGLAIQRTIAEESLREKDRLVSADLDAMTRLQKIGALFVSENNLEMVLEQVVEAAIVISVADFGNIQLLDSKSSALRIAAHRGFPQWWIDFWNSVPEGQGACGTALERGERVIIEDMEQSPIFIDTPVLEVQRKAGVRAVQSTPLLSRSGKLLGIFSTHYKTVHRPDDRTLRLLDLLARNAADIIEHTQAEEALRKSRDELESRVRERTAELEAKNQELQDFSYIASHDLSEPLRKIETFGSILESKCKDRLDSQAADYLSRMTGAANRMKELLEALLRYSRVGTRGDQFRPVRLNEIAKDASGDLEIQIGDAGVSVEIGQLPVIYGDPYQWRQVFQNLIGNAAKYHRSEIKPFIRIYGEEVDRAYRIFIEDNGIGFEEKYLDKIFQPFQRLHGKHEYQGIGIGLAICKKIVERHGGTITATSTPGKGSTFIIELPTLQKQH